MKTRSALLLCLSLSAPFLVASCGQEQEQTQAPVLVEAGPPTVRDVDLKLRYPIELEADEEVSITPVAISGFLRKVLVDVGDEVKGGQLIALVDCREYTAQRTQAETAIAKWEAQVDESTSQLERLTRMGDKLVAEAEIERAQAEARISEAELADARAKLSEAGQRQGYCSMRAPFSGFVSQRFLDAGALIRPGGVPVVNIVKTREVRVVASVIEQDAPQVMKGAQVDVEFHAFPNTLFSAEVARVGRSLDETTRTLRVEMELPNTTEALLPGMTGHAEIVIGKREKAVLVPVTAVLQLEDVAYAYVVRDEDGPRARRVEVELGENLGDWVEITKGITAEDQVITIGRELVDDGTAVRVSESTMKPPASTGPEEDETAEERAPDPTAENAAQEANGSSDTAQGETSPTVASAKSGEGDDASVAANTKAGGSGGPSGSRRSSKGKRALAPPADPEPLRPKREPVKPAQAESKTGAERPSPSASAGGAKGEASKQPSGPT